MDFLKRFFGGGSRDSARTARDRLRIVLIHDRTDISPQLLENLRMEMIEVLTRYMDIDTDKIELDLDRDDQAVALVANVPVLRIKRGGGMEDDDDAPSHAVPRPAGDRSGRKKHR
nr:cell division topological specificity factor MinE [uncultured Fretibacterium sp.]